MKKAGFLFAFYILLLAAIPCCAMDDCPDDKTEQASGHENGDGDCGNCSPFFSCTGCAMATELQEVAPFDLVTLPCKAVAAGYRPPSIQQTSFDFWQPPKLG